VPPPAAPPSLSQCAKWPEYRHRICSAYERVERAMCQTSPVVRSRGFHANEIYHRGCTRRLIPGRERTRKEGKEALCSAVPTRSAQRYKPATVYDSNCPRKLAHPRFRGSTQLRALACFAYAPVSWNCNAYGTHNA